MNQTSVDPTSINFDQLIWYKLFHLKAQPNKVLSLIVNLQYSTISRGSTAYFKL